MKLSLDVLEGGSVVHGDMKFIFQLHEYFGELMGAGVQWETLCPEDSASWDAVVEICLYLLLISCNGLCRIVDRDRHAEMGSTCRDKLVRWS